MPLTIDGRRPLTGKVEIGGAKNAALPIIAATLLTADECLLENVPYIEDIRNMVKVLAGLGVAARFEGPNTLRVKATRISEATLPEALAMASHNPARALALEDRFGSLAEGRVADLVVLDPDLRVALTVVGGQIVYQAGR